MSDTPARMMAAELALFNRNVKAIRHVPDTHASFYERTWIDLAAAERVERDATRVVAYVEQLEAMVDVLCDVANRDKLPYGVETLDDCRVWAEAEAAKRTEA